MPEVELLCEVAPQDQHIMGVLFLAKITTRGGGLACDGERRVGEQDRGEVVELALVGLDELACEHGQRACAVARGKLFILASQLDVMCVVEVGHDKRHP